MGGRGNEWHVMGNTAQEKHQLQAVDGVLAGILAKQHSLFLNFGLLEHQLQVK